MSNGTSTDTTPPPRRTFGTATLVLAVVATGIVAAGGSWLLVGRGERAGTAATAHAKEQWQCPMHPTIVQDHPGDCPICGMKLVKVEAAPGSGAKAAAAAPHDQWQCPMHPSIVQDHPGDCPVCGMKLVKVDASAGAPGRDAGGGGAPVEGLATVSIDPARQQLIGLQTAEVSRGKVGGAWRTVGRVAIDETRVRHINVKIPAYVERINVDFVGRAVRKGEPLFSVYSPDLLSAQDEYLLAVKTRKSLSGAGASAGDGEALVAAARRKLQLWDVPESEIDRLEKTGQPTKTLTIHSPISGVVTKKDVVEGMKLDAGAMPYEIVDLSQVWVLADVYESELRHVKMGMLATLTLNAYPNRAFKGRVQFVDPLLDPKTRTVKVRISFPNGTGELKPEMFGDVVLQGRAREGLRIPADAVIDSGTSKVVFVSLGEGKFQPRGVRLGSSDGQAVEVVSGLSAGERVVTRANFLVDSESRLRASLAEISAKQGAAPGPAPASADAKGAGGADAHAGHGAAR